MRGAAPRDETPTRNHARGTRAARSGAGSHSSPARRPAPHAAAWRACEAAGNGHRERWTTRAGGGRWIGERFRA